MTAFPKSFVPDETDLIEQALDDSIDRFAPLAALHDEGGMWEHQRKIVLAEARLSVRKAHGDKTPKLTVDQVDDMARTSIQYRNYIEDGITERESFLRMKTARIEHYIRRRDLDKRGMR